MKLANTRLFALLLLPALFLSACGASATPDASAIATSAVQTVEARYTEQAALQPTHTEVPPTPEPTSTPEPLPTAVPPTQTAGKTPLPRGNGTPCLSANFLADVTVVDYSIIAPGAKFTKTWRVKNTGSCAWDSGYKLVLDSGNAMGSVTSFPLPAVVNQGQTVDISIELTAPATEGVYKGYWKISTPFGGTMGFGDYDYPLSVVITAATNAKKEFSVVTVTYDPLVRTPKTGCPAAGTVYSITAYISTNGTGLVDYHWVRNPDDGSKPEVITLNFKEAGTKAVTYEWRLKPEAIQNIDRWMAIYIDTPNQVLFDKSLFTFSCQ